MSRRQLGKALRRAIPVSGLIEGSSFVLTFNSDLVAGSGATYYYGPGAQSTAEGEVQIAMPKCIARNMRNSNNVAATGGRTTVYTLRVAGADTALTATTTDPAVSSSDLTNSVAISAGSLVCVSVVTAGGAASTRSATVIEFELR